MDESNLTGESDLIVKNNERDPILLAGTRMIEGEGTMLVTAVGPHSQQGIIVSLLYQQPEEEKGLYVQQFKVNVHCMRQLT